MLVNVTPPALKERRFPMPASGDSDDSFHQNVNVPGPVTVVCRMDDEPVTNTYPLCAADTPSCVVAPSANHVPPLPVPLVVQVRLVALRASPNCASADTETINNSAIETQNPRRRDFIAFFYGSSN